METYTINKDSNFELETVSDILYYNAYASNRDNGCSHEFLIAHGVGREEFAQIYENEKSKAA